MFIKFASQDGVDYYFDERGVVAVLSNQPEYALIGFYRGASWEALTMVSKSGFRAELVGTSDIWSKWEPIECGDLTGLQAQLDASGVLSVVAACGGKLKTVASIKP